MDEWEKKFREWKEKRALGEPSFFGEERTLGRAFSFRKREPSGRENLESGKIRTSGRENYNGFEKDIRKENIIGKKDSFVQRAGSEIEIVEDKSLDYIREPKHIRVIKILVILIPLIIIGYLLYAHIFSEREFNYFYDIGGEGDNYLTPLQRISEKFEDGENYRNLTQNLVYFNSPIVPGSKNVKVEVKFSDSFNQDSIFYVGAKDKQVWHYDFKPIYNPSLSDDSNFIYYQGAYKTSDKLNNLTKEEILEERNLVIASDSEILIKEREDINFSHEISIINTSLRGGHIFYTYLDEEINLSVKKQDLNWYNGSDELLVNIYDSLGNILGNFSLDDDGIVDSRRGNSIIMGGNFYKSGVKRGVYKIEFVDFDGLIREIKINSNKIVAYNRIYLADSDIFFKGLEKNTRIYTEFFRDSEISFKTWHKDYLQNVKVNDRKYFVKQINNDTLVEVKSGEYYLYIEKNDLIINAPGYFAFSKENYFEPFENRIVKLKNDKEWILGNVDYLIVDYNKPEREDEWFIGRAEFNIDETYYKDNKLSLVFNSPQLNDEENKREIKIDWINISVYKPGILRLGGKNE